MTEPKRDRLLIPDNQIIVVMDTAPVRGLAYTEEVPPWVETFALMAKQNYSFTLADGTFAELVAQRQRNALSPAECGRILARLQRFLNLQLPVLPGKKDVLGMLGINREPWSEQECRNVSLAGWEWLKLCTIPGDLPPPEWVLQEERDDWITMFAEWQRIFDEIKSKAATDEPIDFDAITPVVIEGMERVHDEDGTLVPSIALRAHLQNRYIWRQFVRMQKDKEPYDPESPKKRNDGIDADLYRYLLLPALIVTHDKAFFGGLSDIQSFQKSWFYTPQLLADEWLEGNQPAPMWPEQIHYVSLMGT